MKSSSTTVTQKLTDLELIFKLKTDLARFRRNQQAKPGQTPKAA
jgi:hypothetical protein